MIKVTLALFISVFRRYPALRGGTMTPLRVSIFAAIAAILLLVVIFELIRSRRLQERYALLWLVTGLRAARSRGLARRARTCSRSTVGIAYPPSALFVVAALFILVVLLHYSTVISELVGAEPARSPSGSRCSSRSSRKRKPPRSDAS